MSKLTQSIAILGVVAGLGVAALPLSTYAAPVIDGPAPTEGAVSGATYDGTKDGKVTSDTNVKLIIEDLLSIDTDKTEVDLSAAPHTGAVKVTVVTNNSTGYDLAIKGTGTPNATSLTNTKPSADQIIKGDGTFTAPAALSTTVSQWGYSVAGEAAFTEGLYAGVTGTDQIIHSESAATTDAGVATDVTFAASLKNGQAAGTYNGKVTFTATNKANS